MKDCLCGDPDCPIDYGHCHCGCGQKTSIAPQNATTRGLVKGEPYFFVKGHASSRRQDLHVLTEIDTKNRRATCSRCGPTTIRFDSWGEGKWRCVRQLVVQHRLHTINTETKKAWCLACQDEVDIKIINKKRGRWACVTGYRAQRKDDRARHREKRLEASREWHRKNPDHFRNYNLLRNYGITSADYDTMLANQGGVCFICQEPPPEGKSLHVDHCHTLGVVRGLLCIKCNRALGLLADNPERIQRALDYVQRWQAA